MGQIKVLVSIFFFVTTTLLSAQERAIPVKITQIRGTAYVFTKPGEEIYKAAPLTILRNGHFLLTGANSTALIDFTTNGIGVLGPRTLLYIGARSKRGLRHVNLIQGSFYYQTRPDFRNRPPAVITTIRDNPEGFVGERYKILFTEKEKSLEVLSGRLQKIAMKPIDRSQPVEDEDEWGDSGDDFGDSSIATDSLSPDELQDMYFAQLEEQIRGPKRAERFEVIVDKKAFEGKLVTRGIYNIEETSVQRQDEITIIQNDGEPVVQNFDEIRQFNRPRTAYDVRLELKTDRKLGEAHLFASGWLEYGSPSSNYRSPLQIFNTRKEGRGPIELNEIYLTNNWTNTDLSIGKKIFKTGTGLILSPMDRITPKDLYDPLDFKDLGNWMVQVDHFFGNSSLTYVLIPYFLTNKSGVTFLTEIEEEVIEPEQIYPKGDQKSFTHYLQYKTILGGWDFITGLKYGPNLYPIYTQTVDPDIPKVFTYKEHPNVMNALFGFSTTLGPNNFYGEAVYQYAPSANDDTYLTGLLGIKYRNTGWAGKLGFEAIEVFAEISKEEILEKQNSVARVSPTDVIDNPDDYTGGKNNIQSSINWRSQRDNGILRVVFQVNSDLSFNTSLNQNFTDGSRLTILGTEYRLKEGLTFRLNYETYSLDLAQSTRDNEILPFGFEFQSDSTESARRDFARTTLRIDYLF